jgi:hypothetical protein
MLVRPWNFAVAELLPTIRPTKAWLRSVLLSDIYPVYDWVNDNGRGNIGEWIEAAAKKAGK